MAQTIELAQVRPCPYYNLNLCSIVLHAFVDGEERSSEGIGKKYQDRWQSEKLFEVNAPPAADTLSLSHAAITAKYPKWFGNFLYPYMNGSLHLGQAGIHYLQSRICCRLSAYVR